MNRIKLMRAVKEMTIDELSAKSGVSKATIIRLEHGKNKATALVLFKLAKALDCELDELE